MAQAAVSLFFCFCFVFIFVVCGFFFPFFFGFFFWERERERERERVLFVLLYKSLSPTVDIESPMNEAKVVSGQNTPSGHKQEVLVTACPRHFVSEVVSTKWSWMNQEGNRRHMLGDPVCLCGYPAQASEHFSLCFPLCNNIRNHTINEIDANKRNANTLLFGSDQLHSEVSPKLVANYELVLLTACPRPFVSEVARTKWSWMNFGGSKLYRRHLFGDRVLMRSALLLEFNSRPVRCYWCTIWLVHDLLSIWPLVINK